MTLTERLLARLRILRGLTQEQLAEQVGTKQPSIARLESGKGEPKLSFLRRVAEALDARIEVQIVPAEQDAARTVPPALRARARESQRTA